MHAIKLTTALQKKQFCGFVSVIRSRRGFREQTASDRYSTQQAHLPRKREKKGKKTELGAQHSLENSTMTLREKEQSVIQ